MLTVLRMKKYFMMQVLLVMLKGAEPGVALAPVQFLLALLSVFLLLFIYMEKN